jgi:hypothetical protein
MNFALSSPGMPLIPGKSRSMKRNHFAIRYAILMLLMCFFSSSVIAQKVNPDTLNPDQLNSYIEKAVKMNTAGIVLTAGGIGIALTGLGLLTNYAFKTPYEDWDNSVTNLYAVITLGGMASTIAGVTLWVVGGNRKTKAELSLQKFTIVPENSVAFGLGLTIRF